MYEYGYCGRRLRSSVPLPELPPAPAMLPADGGWSCGPGAVPRRTAAAPARSWLQEDGTEWLRITRGESGFLLEFAEGAVFHLTATRVAWRAADLPLDTLRHLLIDQVLPLALSTQGAFAVHAACVAYRGAAMMFAGASGRGKSTLAAALAARGCALLADDCVVLREQEGGWLVQPAYPGVRLWPDAAARLNVDTSGADPVAHYTSKIRVPVSAAAAGVTPLARLYLLEWTAGEPGIRVPGAGASIDLLRCVFRLDTDDRPGQVRDFDRACALTRNHVRHLAAPRSLDALDTTTAAVLADAETLLAGVCA